MYLAMCDISRLFFIMAKKETTESVGNFTNLLALIASYFVNTQPDYPLLSLPALQSILMFRKSLMSFLRNT